MRLMNVILGVGLVGMGFVVGCGGDDETKGTTTGGSPTCEPQGECAAVKSDCLALTDNASKTADVGLRISQLSITKPDALAKGAVKGIVSTGVTMNLDDCNLQGNGTFSWLLDFDIANKKLTTGGAKPVTDPRGGYSFVNETVKGFDLKPLTLDAPVTDGAFSASAPGTTLIVPIYLDAGASDVVLLPLHDVAIKNATLSSDNNCIGKYNADTLDPVNSCLPDDSAGQSYFTDGASLDGFVTIEESDTVIVSALNQSLCVLLSGDASANGNGASPNQCKRDANNKIELKGDWCAATNAAATADCADAFQLGASFAASAVKINK